MGGGFEYKDGEHAERTLDGQTFVRMRSEEQSLFSEGKKVGAPFFSLGPFLTKKKITNHNMIFFSFSLQKIKSRFETFCRGSIYA